MTVVPACPICGRHDAGCTWRIAPLGDALRPGETCIWFCPPTGRDSGAMHAVELQRRCPAAACGQYHADEQLADLLTYAAAAASLQPR